MRGDWRADALCREVGTDLFYLLADDNAGARTARRVCRLCGVQAECLAFALENREEHGIWGAATPLERRRLARGLPARRPKTNPASPGRNRFGHPIACKCGMCQRLKDGAA